jgi:hypothetical protein
VLVAGVSARLASGRYDVAIAVINGSKLVDHTRISAPAGEAESGQLHELNVRAHEVLRPHTPEYVILWPPDPPPGGGVKLKPTLATGRAEGAILAAAGELGIQSDTISGAGVRAAGGSSTDAAVAKLCSGISGLPGDASVRRAVAAACAWQIRRS